MEGGIGRGDKEHWVLCGGRLEGGGIEGGKGRGYRKLWVLCGGRLEGGWGRVG